MSSRFDQIQNVLDGIADAAVVLSSDRRLLYANPLYERLATLAPGQLAQRIAAGSRCYEVFSLDICAAACAGCRALDARGPLRVDDARAAERPGGRPQSFMVNAMPVTLGDGEVVIVEIYRDVTEIRARTKELHQAQAQLVHQEKMSSLGRMVAGIAHELNNPINFIYGNVDFVAQYMEDLLGLVKLLETGPLSAELKSAVAAEKERIEFDILVEDWRKLLRSIRAGAERTASIVQDLKKFSRAGGDLAEADIVAGIETTLNLIGPLLKNRVEVRRRVATGIPRILCHAGHVNQVFMNILTNAAQAIPGAGWIEVSIEVVEDGRAVRVAISDSGPGISAALIAKLADPFFTTKEVGEGTGLGLWISENIVRSHGGTLVWGNRPGAGAEFVVTLPVRALDGTRSSP